MKSCRGSSRYSNFLLIDLTQIQTLQKGDAKSSKGDPFQGRILALAGSALPLK